MTSQEQELLQDFLKQVTDIRGTVKDRKADALISKTLAQQPDATYLLEQHDMQNNIGKKELTCELLK